MNLKEKLAKQDYEWEHPSIHEPKWEVLNEATKDKYLRKASEAIILFNEHLLNKYDNYLKRIFSV